MEFFISLFRNRFEKNKTDRKFYIFITNLTDLNEFDILMNDFERIGSGEEFIENVKIIKKKEIFKYEEFMMKFNQITEIYFSFETNS